jgi:hypothetical protein
LVYPLVPALRATEDEEGEAHTEKRSGNDVREPVHLEIGTAPGHADDPDDSEYRPPAAAPTRHCEEENKRHAGCAGIRGVTGRKRRADRMDDPARRARPADKTFEHGRTQ